MTTRPSNVGDRGLVTVVICAYNAGEFLRPSVESVLRQTYENLEVLIVDDGSTDGSISTISSLRDPRVRILRQRNQGKSVALNHALSKLRGQFYAVHDADDLSYPQRIEKQVRCMCEHSGIAAVFCGHDLILNDEHVAPTFPQKNEEQCRRDIDRMRMPGHDPTAMYRVSMVEDFRYDESLRIAQGYDYIVRVGERFPMRVMGECLYSYRIHGDTVTKRDPTLREQMLREATKKIFDRRGLPYDKTKASETPPMRRNKSKHHDNDLVAHFMQSTVDLRHVGRWAEAIRTAARCSSMHPLDPYYYKPTLYAVAPLSLIDWYRARESRGDGPRLAG